MAAPRTVIVQANVAIGGLRAGETGEVQNNAITKRRIASGYYTLVADVEYPIPTQPVMPPDYVPPDAGVQPDPEPEPNPDQPKPPETDDTAAKTTTKAAAAKQD